LFFGGGLRIKVSKLQPPGARKIKAPGSSLDVRFFCECWCLGLGVLIYGVPAATTFQPTQP
ncbi:MAG: hypothetical protein ACREFR_14035, partial [Limisphaerales bacterium]